MHLTGGELWVVALSCLVLAGKFKFANSDDEADKVNGLKKNSNSVEEGFDPLRWGERPKIFVDYLNGPLKGRTRSIFQLSITRYIF